MGSNVRLIAVPDCFMKFLLRGMQALQSVVIAHPHKAKLNMVVQISAEPAGRQFRVITLGSKKMYRLWDTPCVNAHICFCEAVPATLKS